MHCCDCIHSYRVPVYLEIVSRRLFMRGRLEYGRVAQYIFALGSTMQFCGLLKHDARCTNDKCDKQQRAFLTYRSFYHMNGTKMSTAPGDRTQAPILFFFSFFYSTFYRDISSISASVSG